MANDESFAYGIDRLTLNRIATATGGMMLDSHAPVLEPPEVKARKLPLFPWLLALAGLFLAAAFWVGGRQA